MHHQPGRTGPERGDGNRPHPSGVVAAAEPAARAAAERLAATAPGLAEQLAVVTVGLGRDLGAFHLEHLATALDHDEPALFHAYLGWAESMLAARGVEVDGLHHHLDVLIDELGHRVGPDTATAATRLATGAVSQRSEAAAADPSELPTTDPGVGPTARLLPRLLAGDGAGATDLALAALAGGLTLEGLYLDVLGPCLREIGRRWQIGRLSVAEEHLATATTQLVMARLYPQTLSAPHGGRQVVVACVGGELHEVGARMVADLFELAGWRSTFLGASTPTADVARTVADHRPDLLAVSASMPTHVTAVREVVDAVAAAGVAADVARVPIIVGGRPFLQAPGLWRRVGADGTARDAREAVRIGTELARSA